MPINYRVPHPKVSMWLRLRLVTILFSSFLPQFTTYGICPARCFLSRFAELWVFVFVAFVLTLVTDFQQVGDILFTSDHLLEEVAGPSSLHSTSPTLHSTPSSDLGKYFVLSSFSLLMVCFSCLPLLLQSFDWVVFVIFSWIWCTMWSLAPRWHRSFRYWQPRYCVVHFYLLFMLFFWFRVLVKWKGVAP